MNKGDSQNVDKLKGRYDIGNYKITELLSGTWLIVKLVEVWIILLSEVLKFQRKTQTNVHIYKEFPGGKCSLKKCFP